MLVSQQHSSKKHEPRLKKARPVFGLYCLLAGGGRRGVTGCLLGLHVLICKLNEASIHYYSTTFGDRDSVRLSFPLP